MAGESNTEINEGGPTRLTEVKVGDVISLNPGEKVLVGTGGEVKGYHVFRLPKDDGRLSLYGVELTLEGSGLDEELVIARPKLDIADIHYTSDTQPKYGWHGGPTENVPGRSKITHLLPDFIDAGGKRVETGFTLKPQGKHNFLIVSVRS